MKKQFVSILAAITILCNLCFTEVYAFEDSTSALKEFTLTENTTFFKSSHSTVAQDDSENYANISIDSAGQVASITFSIDEHVYTVNMTGMLDAISSGTNTGYVGVFEGTFDPDSNDPTFAPLSKSDLPIIADIVFTGNESFCALTFGDASENKNPIIYHFGIYSDSIRNISKAYIVLKTIISPLPPRVLPVPPLMQKCVCKITPQLKAVHTLWVKSVFFMQINCETKIL